MYLLIVGCTFVAVVATGYRHSRCRFRRSHTPPAPTPRRRLTANAIAHRMTPPAALLIPGPPGRQPCRQQHPLCAAPVHPTFRAVAVHLVLVAALSLTSTTSL